MANTQLSEKEIKKIDEEFLTTSTKDITIKQRQFNIERLTPFTKVIYKTKKNKYKYYKNKNKNKEKEPIKFKTDPYKFKTIPLDIRQTIIDLIHNYQTSISTISYKSKVPLHIIDNFLNKSQPIDNYDLKLILDHLNYNLN